MKFLPKSESPGILRGRRAGVRLMLPAVRSPALLVIALLLAACGNDNAGGISASGTIEVVDVTVSAKVPGEITRRYVDEGSVVRAGDTLALIRHLTAP
ncbi:MAG TPA: biotin/lipoyl-binding protein, partial [Bacteroidota bacterium]|nr:biotin/lipoyl-binding protein [Bacteroidota bacterium]